MAEGEVTGHSFPAQKGEREGRIRMIVIQIFIEIGQVIIVLTMVVARRIVVPMFVGADCLGCGSDRHRAKTAEHIRPVLDN